MSSNKQTIYKKFMGIFSVIVILYTAVIVAMMLFLHHQTLATNNDHHNRTFVQGASRLIDYQIEIANNITFDLLQNVDILDYVRKTEYDYFVMNRAYHAIRGYSRLMHPLNIEIAIYRRDESTLISTNGFFYFADYLRFVGIDNDYLQKPSDHFLNSPSNIFLYHGGMLTHPHIPTMIYRLHDETSDNDFYVFLTFGRGDIHPFLPIALPNDIGEFSMIFSPTSHPFPADRHWMTYEFESQVIPHLFYIYRIRTRDLVAINGQFLQIIVYPFIVLFLLGLFIVIWATNKSYTPVASILSIISGKSTSEAVNYKEILSIDDAVKKINTNHLGMHQQMLKQAQYSKENFLKNMIYNVHVPEDLSQNLKNLNLTNYEFGGTLTLLSFAGLTDVEQQFDNQTLQKLRNQLLIGLQQCQMDLIFITVPIDHKKFCLLFESHDEEKIVAFLKASINKLTLELPLDITFSMTPAVKTIVDFHDAFKAACFLNDNRYKYLNTNIITAKSEMILEDNSYRYSLETEARLIEALRAHEIEKVEKLLKQVLDNNLIEENINAYSIIRFKYALLNTVKRILNMNNLSSAGFFQTHPQLLAAIEGENPLVIHRGFLTIFSCILKNLNIKSHQEISHQERIINYIQNAFCEELSLTDVATACGLSEGYVSKLIKSSTNNSFKSYLGSLRVEKAKEILKKSSYKISEVSLMVGYPNVNTFIRVFKEFEHISPGEYKKKHS